MAWATVDTLEFYKWDYRTLVERLGKEQALQKVAMYQSQPYANTPCVKNGRLLQTYTGAESETIQPVINPVALPQLTESEYTDTTNKGITQLPDPEKFKQWQHRQQAARRAKKYV
jgi:hypothetical protein